MIDIRDLNAFYGGSHVLHDISLTLGEKSRTAILGRNGAGKSTFLKSIINGGPRVTGQRTYRSATLDGLPTHEVARRGIALVPEDRRIFSHLTVNENLRLATSACKGAEPIDVDSMIANFPMLAPLTGRMGNALSGGQQQMVAVARGFMARPSLLMLDEPTEGLAPVIVKQLAESVRKLCDLYQTGLLLCEQNIWFAHQCTDIVYVIAAGRVVYQGDWADFDAKPEIRDRYLAV